MQEGLEKILKVMKPESSTQLNGVKKSDLCEAISGITDMTFTISLNKGGYKVWRLG